MVALSILWVGVSATGSPPMAGAASVPSLEPEACDPVPSEPERVTCASLVVPEQRGSADGPAVRMRVAIVAPVGPPSGPEPLVFLAGGPGYGSAGGFESFLGDASLDRTVVLVDYRGVGRSEPFLGCPEDDALAFEGLGLPADDPDLTLRRRAATQACRDRLVAAGVDLAAYDYEHIAADLDTLRQALGVAQWDLWGLSNGGRVALEVARRYPDGVRSLVLDAAAPPQENLVGDLWSNAALAFERLFAGCASDPVCGAAYPTLGATFETLVSQLTAAPIEVRVPDASGAGEIVVRFDGVVALNALRTALYEAPLIPLLPFFISELAQGRQFETVASLIIERTGDDGISDGMGRSVNCREEIAFLDDDHFEIQAAAHPLLAPMLRLQAADDSCDIWDVGVADPVIDEAVASDIPALVLVGEFDPVHPERSARRIAEHLSNSTLVVVPGLGHGTLFGTDCPRRMLTAFLAEPSSPVDTACVVEMPPVAWVVP